MKRRHFLFTLGAAPLAALLPVSGRTAPMGDATDGLSLKQIQQGWKSLLPADAEVADSTEPLQTSEAEWKKMLPPDRYAVLREEDTENPGSSPLNHEKRPGVYVCAGCSLPLFTSQMKYDSGTGWPSFFTHIPDHLATKRDWRLLLPRTEYHCARCGGHQGHVFDDGPPPTGQRWCNNGLALRFIPA